MINRYLKMDLDDAQPGMVLWEAVVDSKGTTLLPAGTSLTSSMVTSLQRRGIDEVFVVNDAVTENDLRLERERIEKRMAALFRHCNDSLASQALLKSILEYRLGNSK
jgi:hypothetical protein